jgi:L-aminopeptidase/D-esterase-like protein
MSGWGSIRDVPGVLAGHAQRTFEGWATGVTAVIPPPGTVGSVDVRGGGPATHETDALNPSSLVPTVDAVVLTGGSAFGLVSASGVQRWCAQQGRGFAAGPQEDPRSIIVPIVPAAAIFDLGRGGDVASVPDPDLGYAAALVAAAGTAALSGRVGAGTGAMMAMQTLPGACGTASRTLARSESGTGSQKVVVGALAVVNAFGSPFAPDGTAWAGPFLPPGARAPGAPPPAGPPAAAPANTTLVVIATNAQLDPGQCYRTAVSGQDGIARALVPAHTLLDGDTVFTLATGQVPISPMELIELQALAAQVVLMAITDAVAAASA